MLDDEVVALLEAGSALIVGTVGDDGVPRAGRGWGLDVLSRSPCRVRVLVDAHDEESLDQLAPGCRVAVTAADVPTLRSVQLKGATVAVEPVRPADHERVARYTEAFYRDIADTDGTPLAVLQRLTPDAVVGVVIDVADVFDQTPGPSAGRAVAPTSGPPEGGPT